MSGAPADFWHLRGFALGKVKRKKSKGSHPGLTEIVNTKYTKCIKV